MLDHDDLAVLRLAADSRQVVEIVVAEAWYGCCGRAPMWRGDYQQTYQGVIMHLADDRLLLHAIGIRTLNYHVIAELTAVLDVRFVD